MMLDVDYVEMVRLWEGQLVDCSVIKSVLDELRGIFVSL